jgi:hypothetical protein
MCQTEIGKSVNITSIATLLFIILALVVINGLKNGYNYIYDKGYCAGRDSARLQIARIQSDTSKVICKPINDD